MEIVIGTKAWSSWSLRPWLVLRRTGVAFTETLVPLREFEASEAAIAKHSPSHLVPVLKDGDLVIWDSLAICEYLHERHPEAALWPANPALRAIGRAAAAEMHSGFGALRRECPMALDAPVRRLEIGEDVAKDVRKILERWSQLLARSGGPYLLGAWSIADAFYTPVATRFHTHAIDLAAHGDTGTAAAYAARLLDNPDYRAWQAAAQA